MKCHSFHFFFIKKIVKEGEQNAVVHEQKINTVAHYNKTHD